MVQLLRSFGKTDTSIALYTLGKNLHVLHDFTDDPEKLMETAAFLDPHGNQPPGPFPLDLGNALTDLGDVRAVGGGDAQAASVHRPTTVKALTRIIQHLSGVPGRKNLVWVLESPALVPPDVLRMAQQADGVLYPVLVRLVPGFSGENGCLGGNIGAAQDLAAVTGGRAFFDAMDLSVAVRTTEEDIGTTYVLGYYPTEEMLDGRFHKLTVRLNREIANVVDLEVSYRQRYRATKVALVAPVPTLAELFSDPLESTSIGLSGEAIPEPAHAGLYAVRLIVDLHNIHLDRKDGHFTGAFDLSVPIPSSKGTVQTANLAVDLTEAQLAEALEQGYSVSVTEVEPQSGEIRLVIRDVYAGIAGSLRVPVTKQ